MTIRSGHRCDVLIIGSGLAGLLTALRIFQKSDAHLTLACKGALLDSNSSFAQGGVAAVTHSNAADSNARHLEDTLRSGAGLTDAEVAARVIESGALLIEALSDLGVAFDTHNGSGFELALEGGHSQARVLHSKDTTGRAITTALAARLLQLQADNPERVTVLEHAHATELLNIDGRCLGAKFLRLGDQQSESCGQELTVLAPNVVLATGGVGQIFARTTNPPVATGDGIALAYRAGARLADMEFVQFHPTALCKPGAPAFLISEAVRGAGAVLLDARRNRFAARFHKDGELATRDVVARAIHTIMVQQDIPSVYLDLRPIGISKIADKFPTIVATCRNLGIDPLVEPIPVCPAAHYFMGGISADFCGRTTVTGLYAIGECASTGLHGANRLASNSLLEAGAMAINLADLLTTSPISSNIYGRYAQYMERGRAPYLVPDDADNFRREMYLSVGLVRSRIGLSRLLQQPLHWSPLDNTDIRMAVQANLVTVGRLIAEAAMIRQESRGAHFRDDYSTTSDAFARRLFVSQTGWQWQDQPIGRMAIQRQAALSA